jgi:hypothetical protein
LVEGLGALVIVSNDSGAAVQKNFKDALQSLNSNGLRPFVKNELLSKKTGVIAPKCLVFSRKMILL